MLVSFADDTKLQRDYYKRWQSKIFTVVQQTRNKKKLKSEMSYIYILLYFWSVARVLEA